MKDPSLWWGLGELDDSESSFFRVLPQRDFSAFEPILSILGELGACGFRHYVRFGRQRSSISTFEFYRDGRRYAGVVHDISTAGLSCTFKPEPADVGHMAVAEMHLNLPARHLALSGYFTVKRVVSGQMIHVFLFDGNVSQDIRDGIHEFICKSLEAELSAR